MLFRSLAFNFRFVKAQWNAADFRSAIEDSLAANSIVNAPTTWVTENHDVTRSVTRYGSGIRLAGEYVPDSQQQSSIDLDLGTCRARAVALMLLTLPGAVYIYNGQELGLPNVDDLPDEVLQDPSFFRTRGEVRGRDGCRIPLPWSHAGVSAGFSSSSSTWLPIPNYYRDFAADLQRQDASSMLRLYQQALHLRRKHPALRRGKLSWLESSHGVLGYVVQTESEQFEVWVNFTDSPIAMPAGRVMLASLTADSQEVLLPNSAIILLKSG